MDFATSNMATSRWSANRSPSAGVCSDWRRNSSDRSNSSCRSAPGLAACGNRRSRFFGRDTPLPPHGRGLMLVWLGLVLYDAYARDPSLPKHRLHRVASGKAQPGTAPPVNPQEYHWLASYYDAQVTYPERLTLALLSDACQAAAAHGQRVQVFTYHEARLQGRRVSIARVSIARVGSDRVGSGPPAPDSQPIDSRVVDSLEPAAIVNATGAWVDETLRRLAIPSEPLMGGTKGSHFITDHRPLADALGGRAIYAEARDGRPVFILPWAGRTLVGTTDETYTGDPGRAVASPAELAYLLDAVRHVFPQFALDDGRRQLVVCRRPPLGPHPRDGARKRGAGSHHARPFLQAPSRYGGLPLYSIVGGKLTTCRSLAEESAATVLADWAFRVRPILAIGLIPGSQPWPATAADAEQPRGEIAGQSGLPPSAVEHAWQLCGTEAAAILGPAESAAPCLRGDRNSPGTGPLEHSPRMGRAIGRPGGAPTNVALPASH